MLKKYFSISLLFIAFSFLLSHQVVPHHHHDNEKLAKHYHEHGHSHDHESEGHSHHFLDFFFSLLHHSGVDNHAVINHSVSNLLIKAKLLSFVLPDICLLIKDDDPLPEFWEHYQVSFPGQTFSKSLSLRGPPLV